MKKPKKPPSAKTPPASTNPWPRRLKALRERLGLTQTEAAERIGTVLRTWQNYEYGRRQPGPMVAKLIELAFPEKPPKAE
jgi:DNA-binding transcriptional regulator YiaG